MTASDIKTLLVKALTEEADAMLASVGFARPAKSTKFLRKLPNAAQSFDISLAVHPSYSQGALAHVYPRLRLSMPEVCHIARELVAGNSVLLANSPDIMVNRPLEHLVPKPERVQWYAFQEGDFPRIAHDVAESCVMWGLPFFDDYRSAEDVVRGFETGDEWPKLQANWSIFVAAAYLVLGQLTRAKEVIDSAFAAPGSQKKYATVFENLKRILPAIPDSPR